jgi:hypothetical protein
MYSLFIILRDARWLEVERARAWAMVLATMSVLTVLALIVATRGGYAPDPWQRPLGTDFVSFWTAAKLALGGVPAAAWSPAFHAAAERANFPPEAGFAADYYAFFYPPPFLLLCLPFALLPYGTAVSVWLGSTCAACLLILRALLPKRWPAALVFFAAPATFANAGHGQNGALCAALLGAASLQLDRRPWLAGACLGGLCFKPQLALLVLPALVAARRWRALGCAASVVAGLSLTSLLVFGEAAWLGFFSITPVAQAVLKSGAVGFAKMVSMFAAARLLGADVVGAGVAQACTSVLALSVVVTVARRRPGPKAEGAALAIGGCLATPFLLDYDLMLLLIPLAWVASVAQAEGYLPWEKLVLACAFLLPLVARPLASFAGLPIAPCVLMALLWIVARRALREPERVMWRRP